METYSSSRAGGTRPRGRSIKHKNIPTKIKIYIFCLRRFPLYTYLHINSCTDSSISLLYVYMQTKTKTKKQTNKREKKKERAATKETDRDRMINISRSKPLIALRRP